MPTPTPEQIETTREVLMLDTYTETAGLISDLEEAQWTAQVSDNTLWNTKRNSVTIIDSTVKIDPASLLGRIRDRSRRRFGLPPVEFVERVWEDSGFYQTVAEIVL
jgi:hypothetical protein